MKRPKGGKLMSRRVLAVEYHHAESEQRLPYRHDFTTAGVEMWALPDGAILIRHPERRLWGEYDVHDGE